MSLKNFITSRAFLKHVLLALLLVFVIVFFILQRLKSYTHHGESYSVPDFEGLTINEIESVSEEYDMKYEIIDSLHVAGAKPGAVVEQVPEAGFKVKKNRIVSLTINSTVPEMVVLPKLTDISFRQAIGLIENCGIKHGKITYQPSEYNNLVLEVEQNSKKLKQGDIIQKGSSVDLIIGSSSGVQETPLPNFSGLTIIEAKELLMNHKLNTGVLIWDESVITSEDTLTAIIWKQYPGKNIRFVSLGTNVDLWLTVDSLKILQPTLQVTD